jgi:hypothetical protein
MKPLSWTTDGDAVGDEGPATALAGSFEHVHIHGAQMGWDAVARDYVLPGMERAMQGKGGGK